MSELQSRPKTARYGLIGWQAIAGGVVVVAVANLLIFAIARLAGVSFEYTDDTGTHDVTAVGVVIASVPPVVIGPGLAILISRWWRPILRVAQVIGGALAALTLIQPLTADTSTGSRLALAAMHVVLGIVVVLVLEAVWRWSANRKSTARTAV